MRTPKIIFEYSTQYNNLWTDWFKAYEKDIWKKFLRDKKRMKKTPLSERNRIKKTFEYIEKVEKSWKKDERKILEELSGITGLEWTEEFIICYIIWVGKNIGIPLTVRVHSDTDEFINTLIHELIHYLLVYGNNSKLSLKARNYFNRKYRNENQKVISHIPVFAIMQFIFLKFFDMKRLEKHINMMKSSPDYARAWQIVQQEGYHNIIREFRARIK